jgi:hypothetical protein
MTETDHGQSPEVDLTLAGLPEAVQSEVRALVDTEGRLDLTGITDTQAEAVQAEDGPGLVKEAAPLAKIDHQQREPRLFCEQDVTNNFPLRFQQGGMWGLMYGHQPVTQRFQILFPELNEYLRAGELAAQQRQGEVYARDHLNDFRRLPQQQSLRLAYGLMRQLVDQADPGVKDKNGQVHLDYLTK